MSDTITLPKLSDPGRQITINAMFGDAVVFGEGMSGCKLNNGETARFVAKPVFDESGEECIGVQWERTEG